MSAVFVASSICKLSLNLRVLSPKETIASAKSVELPPLIKNLTFRLKNII
ncbi:hypothetical protein [Lawsonia intracellularis]|nr:hypothetical protein [Lawsonia intracellularis]